MKHLVFILFSALLWASNPIVNVGINENYTEIYSGVMDVSLVDGFDHVYDSVELTITNKATGVQYIYNSQQPSFNNISLSEGVYGFFMGTPDPDSIQAFMSFVAYDTAVSITSGVNNIILPARSKQALILVDKNSVDGAPTIQVGNKVAIMSIAANFYYAYVLDRTIITYTIGGNDAVMPIKTDPEVIYLFTAGIGDVGIKDPFIKVIQI